MAPHRKEPSPTEFGSDSDVELNVNYQYKLSPGIPKAMQRIDNLKSKRSEMLNSIEKDHIEKLTALKNEIKAHYQDAEQKIADNNKQQLERYIELVQKRMDCEEKIRKRLDLLQDDCAHMAMLLDAVYAGRKDMAIKAGKAPKPDQSKN
ncbi:hypothetical protein F4804DRAFT_318854 [Jackrogersella minutella]|nr:hypothetical protein F4804DRAFT_318854 [Jackrogersella minutella]